MGYLRAWLRGFNKIGCWEEELLAGKRCSPFLLYAALAVIVISLLVVAIRRGSNPPPPGPPLHQPH
jgi:hypothetical protein